MKTNEEQPAPVPTTGKAIRDLVIEDMKARDQLGLERYGTRLQAHNGRDVLQDLTEELMDALVYLRQLREERKDALAPLLELEGLVKKQLASPTWAWGKRGLQAFETVLVWIERLKPDRGGHEQGSRTALPDQSAGTAGPGQ